MKNEIANKIKKMVKEDQRIRSKKPIDTEKMKEIDNKHRHAIKKIVNEHGLITISEFGKKASYDTWLLIQHFPREELEFLKKYLFLMSENIDDINKKNYAYLEDRINMYEDKPQKYGTQITRGKNDKYFTFHKIKNVKNIDELRKGFGLKPLKEYIESMQKSLEYPIKAPKDYKL